MQGLAVYNADGAITHQLTLDPALARQVITFVEDRGFGIAAYAEGKIIRRRRRDKHSKMNLTLRHEVAPEVVGPLQNLLGSMAINKLIAGATRARSPRCAGS